MKTNKEKLFIMKMRMLNPILPQYSLYIYFVTVTMRSSENLKRARNLSTLLLYHHCHRPTKKVIR